jgi:hypothetical protein
VKVTARAAAALLFGILAVILEPGLARADDLPPPIVYVLTVAPGGALFSLYGHAALCVETVGQPEATCYDYGVADAHTEEELVWGTLRGKKLFVPVAVKQSVMMRSFQDEERAMWKQVLPLTPDEAHTLAGRLETAVAKHEGYAYDPAHSNCTTQLRDLIEEASPGKLRAGSDVVPPGPSFRELCEQGLSGKPFELASVSMFVGGDGEKHPTAWQLMFLPSQLRETIERRFGVKPERVYEPREGITLATSPSAGRLALGLLGFVLSGALVYASRTPKKSPSAVRWRRTLAIVGIVLGALGLVVWGVAATTIYPWMQNNFVLAVLVPFDVGLGFLSAARLRRYLEARLVVLLVVLVLALVHVIVQPLLASVVLAGLPLAAVYATLRKKELAALVGRGARDQVLLQQK